jgi:4-amino-4-deoxy-L-arabinose transferase
MYAARMTWPRGVLAVILVGSALIKLPNLGHRALKGLDESFHAIVAQNLLRHPWAPTLHDGPAIAVDKSDWQNSPVFLHKPPMAMWQIALSYAVLGVNTLALRVPSLLLSTLAVWLTYRIGRELVDETAGLIGAALQGFNPVIAMLVHGNVFSDHVDISLLFWTELAIWLLLRAVRSGKRIDEILCGVAQGFAFLSKLYPALIVTVLAIVARFLLPSPGTPGEGQGEGLSLSGAGGPSPQPSPGVPGEGVRGVRVSLILASTLITILPWNLYAFMRWPDQFLYEQFHALRHLSQDIEQYAGPWDRLVFDYWLQVFHVYYPAVLVAAILVIIRAWRTKDAKLWLLVTWAIGVLIPHLLATSKTPTATLIGWPPMWIMLGYLISQALRGCAMSAGAWAGSMVLPLILHREIPTGGWGYPSVPGLAAAIMLEHLWVVWYVLIALTVGVATVFIPRKSLRLSLCAIAGASMLILAARPSGYGKLCWNVQRVGQNEPSFPQIGPVAQKLPRDAILIVKEQFKLENKTLQFYARRSCYPLRGSWQDVAQRVLDAGGLPYLVSDKPFELPVVFKGDGRVVYACTPGAYDAAPHE